MKPGTTPTLRFKMGLDINLISTVDFLFKLYLSEDAPEVLMKSYPTDVTYDADNKWFVLNLTAAETRLLGYDKVYIDPKICTINGKIPETKIIRLHMTDTLYGVGDTNG